jgi:hypothetical protein
LFGRFERIASQKNDANGFHARARWRRRLGLSSAAFRREGFPDALSEPDFSDAAASEGDFSEARFSVLAVDACSAGFAADGLSGAG